MITRYHPRSLHSEEALDLFEEMIVHHAWHFHHGHIGTEHLLRGLKAAGDKAISSLVLKESPAQSEIDEQILRYIGEGSTAPGSPLQFTEELNALYYRTFALTTRLGLQYVGTDTLLLALLLEPCDGRQILELSGCSVEGLAIRTRFYIGQQDREPPAKERSFSGA